MNPYVHFKIPTLLFRVSLITATLATMVLAFAPLQGTVNLTGTDKQGHFIAFFVLSALLDGSFRNTHFDSNKVVCLLSYALFIELVQSFIPYRDFSWLDMLADALGIFAYAMVIFLIQHIIKKISNPPHQ